MKPAYLIAFFLIIISLGITLYAFSFSIAQHVTITQAMKMPGQTVQVPGKIIKDTVVYDTSRSELRFDVEEMNGKDPQRLTIVYREPKPENFDTATSVEAQGVYKNGMFYAKNLLIKCPSKYNDEKKSAGKQNTAALSLPTAQAQATLH